MFRAASFTIPCLLVVASSGWLGCVSPSRHANENPNPLPVVTLAESLASSSEQRPAPKGSDSDDLDEAASEAQNDELSGIAGVDLVDRGLLYLQENRPAQASQAFRAAIAAGDLNESGRTMAYWHMFLASLRLQARDDAANALSDFVTVGQQVLDAPKSSRVAVGQYGDFAEFFDLERRVARGRAMLSGMWAEKVPSFGRSSDYPVVVRNEYELEVFLEMAPPCTGAADRKVKREPAMMNGQSRSHHVVVECAQAGRAVAIDYFFQTEAK